MKCKHGMVTEHCAYCTGLIKPTSDNYLPRKRQETIKAKPLTKRFPHDPLLNHCVGCGVLTEIAFALYGRLWTITKWITKEKSELFYDPSTGKSGIKVSEQRIPVNGWKRGLICSQCQTSKCRIIRAKDGTEKRVPLCIPDPTPTATTTVLPTVERQTHSTPLPERVPVQAGTLKGKARGHGALRWSPDTKQTFQDVPHSREVHGGCYNKFGGR
jgi:hypothetical protein